MFKPKIKKPEAIKAETEEIIEAINEEEIEEETSEEAQEESEEETEEETKENTDEKPAVEQKINLTPGEVISIVEFNLQRAIQSLQLLK